MDGGDGTATGWVRLSRTCQNACIFCSEHGVLDGTTVAWDDVVTALDAVAAAGLTRVVLSGGEPTLSKDLIKAIKHAKGLGLRVALTTNGRVIKSDKVAQVLEGAGLDEIRISVHAGRRTTHDALTRKPDSWIESLSALRSAGKTGMRTTLVSVMTAHNIDELSHLMHLGTMAGIQEMEVRYPARQGMFAPAAVHAEHTHPMRTSLKMLGTLWYEAKEEVIFLRSVGFDGTEDLGLDPFGDRRQADTALMTMLRQRVFVPQAGLGTTIAGDEGLTKDVVALAESCGGLPQAGLELAARGAPLLDGPWCVGGRPLPDASHGERLHEPPGCATCPMADRCPRLPGKLAKLDHGDIAPLPHWAGVVRGRVALVGDPGDVLTTRHVLPDLATALVALGVDAAVHLGVDAAVASADTVICDAPNARAVLGHPDRSPEQVVVVLDTTLGADLHDLPAPPTLVESWAPGLVGHLVAAGIDLRTVRWRAAPVPAVAGEAGALSDGPVVVLGSCVDLAVLESALVTCTGRLPPVRVLDTSARPLASTRLATSVRDASDEAILHDVLGARCVVFPATAVDDTPDQRRALARDLRWLAVAQAAGRPVIAVRAPGVADGVRHDVTGWLAANSGASELAAALTAVVAEPLRLQRLAVGARQLGTQALPATWAHELVHGRLPDAVPLVPTAPRPWPAW
ncbi:MAG: radical SAM protein [Alphaproteobacteria bacterium]|nr:radical SAM protein [Alphaproteobacteria bacterium]